MVIYFLQHYVDKATSEDDIPDLMLKNNQDLIVKCNQVHHSKLSDNQKKGQGNHGRSPGFEFDKCSSIKEKSGHNFGIIQYFLVISVLWKFQVW